MRRSLRNQLRAVKMRLDKLENRGGSVFVVVNPGEDGEAKIAAAKAAHPGCEIDICRIVYE